jgi:hypothetical protein
MSMAKAMVFSMDETEEQPEVSESQPPTGLSDDERIAEFLRLDTRIKELSIERREHASVLTEIAAAKRNGDQKTVHLQANNGSRVQVEFKTDWECVSADVETAKELLKDEKFNELFKTTYTPKLRNLKSFLNTVYSDEAWETAKAIIKESVKEVDKTPYVSTERSK